MNICVVALGKIGLPLAVQFAKADHHVIGCDISDDVVKAVNSGVPHFVGEADLDTLLTDAVARGSLTATTDTTTAVKGADVVVVVVPLVVDDAAVGVTDVIRGCDLEAATPVQMLLQRLLGLPTPRYNHHALIAGPDGRRLAKRTPGATLADMRAAGVDPLALLTDLRTGRLPVGFGWVDA